MDAIRSNSAEATRDWPAQSPRIAAVICAYDPPAVWRDVAGRLCRFPFSEVFVVDDGSANPLDFQQPRGSETPLRILRCPDNVGLAAARNLALENVQADWVLYVDADLLPDESFLESLPLRLEMAQADGVGFHVREHHCRSDWDFFRTCERDAVTVGGPVEWVSGLLCAYRVAALRAVGGFDPTFRSNGEDVDLGYRLTRAGKALVHIPEVCGEHHRKDTLISFVRMHYRYAVTAKRVDRSRYFPASKTDARRGLPLFHWQSTWPQIRLFLRFLAHRPYAVYLPPLIVGAMCAGARAGRRAVQRLPHKDLSGRPRMNLAMQ